MTATPHGHGTDVGLDVAPDVTLDLDVSAIRRVSPLIDERGLRSIARIVRHASAPRWGSIEGDRLERDDVRAVEQFRETLARERTPFDAGPPPDRVLAWVRSLRDRVAAFRVRIPEGASLDRGWASIDTTSRDDVAARPESLVPDDAPLARMVVYRTAGTTGHALLVPHDARAVACYVPLLELALSRWGVDARLDADDAAMLVCAQARTVTYATALALWSQAGFAKLNLAPGEWPSDDAPRRFFADLAPALLTGDPVSFGEMLARGIEARPRALVTTAVAMSDRLRARLAARFAAPVVDWYSLTETGPIGYACPRGAGYHVVAHDVFVEAIDDRGWPAAHGERGEIAVTGGRNPFLPLLRYRTGDWGRIEHAPCPCGDPMPRVVDLEGRAPVLLRAASGGVVNAVDVSRVLREHPVVQHELVQRVDLSCELAIRAVGGEPFDTDALERELRALFGDVPIVVRFDPALGDRTGKVVPFRSDLAFEE
jgi:phenylacetate-coenzyme A ligase PaaK-like adenylate-forming protein